MDFFAADHSVTIIAFEKNGVKYGMTCAWFMQAGEDRLLCFIGRQSVTGKMIEKNDVIGISTLGIDQGQIAFHFGEGHSDLIDKFEGIPFNQVGTAITIKDSPREMICEVLDVMHLKDIEEDNVIFLKISQVKQLDKKFLHNGDIY